MAFSFKDVLSHVEEVLIDSIKELKKNKKAIKPETALYLFGMALSSFFENSVSTVNIGDKNTQSRLLDSFRLGWKDGISKGTENAPTPAGQAPEAPTETPPEQAGAPEEGLPGPERLGKLPVPPSQAGQTLPSQTGGELPNTENPEEEPPETLKKPEKNPEQKEKFNFNDIRTRFINEGKFSGISLKL